MNFTWLNKQGVENENGEIVQLTGRFSAEYRKDGKVIELWVEDGIMGDKNSISYKRKDFENWSKGGPLSLSEKEQAINTFCEAQKFQGPVPDEE